MAQKKGTGFGAPAVGKSYPKGSTIKKNADGTVTVVPPKKPTKKSK